MKKTYIICMSCITLCSLSVAQDATTDKEETTPSTESVSTSQSEPKRVIVDANYSVETPMVLSAQKDIPSIKKAQTKYIEKTYGKNYGIVINTILLDEKKRYINIVFIEKDNNDNHSILIAFDVTEAMKRMISKDKAKFAEIQKSLEGGGGMTTNVISEDW